MINKYSKMKLPKIKKQTHTIYSLQTDKMLL